MKKRRELDALVGGVKSRRKSSNSSHELLRYNGSESSDDDYRLSSSKVRGSGLCSTCTSVFIFLLLVACMLVCAGLTWMHVEMKKDLEILRLNLQAVEGRGMASTDDVEKLFKQMAAVNKSLEQHTKTLNTVISNISTMNKTVLQVSGRVVKLGEGLKAAPELKQLPEKLQTVSQTVATMGSDITNVKETVAKISPFMKTTTESISSLKKEFDSIKDQVHSDEDVPGREGMKPDLANVIQVLTNQLQTVNSTVAAQLSALIKSDSHQEEKINQLEESTQMLVKNISSISTDHTSISSEHASLTDDYTSENFKSSVTDIVNNLLSEGPLPSGSNIEAVMTNITRVLSSIQELEEKYEKLDKQSETVPDIGDEGESGVKYVSMEMFETLGDGFETKVENLNNSFVKLKADVSTMAQLLTSQSNTVTNLTHQVEGTKMFLTTLQHKLEQIGAQSPPVTKKPVPEGTTTLKLTTARPPEVPKVSTERPSEVPKVSTMKPEGPTTKKEEEKVTGKPSAAPSTAQSKKGTISVDWIKTPKDLEVNFSRWDRSGGNGQVSYDSLDQYLGPQTPDEEDLKPFDEDGNGLYSLKEFAKAFGMTLSTTAEPDTEPTQPPR